MRNTIRLALIGAGAWGGNFINTINLRDDIELTSIFTQKRDIRSIYQIKNKCKVFNDWKALILEKNFEGVIIATPASTHIEIMELCILLNIPIIVEKPITTFLKKAYHIYDLAKVRNSIVLVDHIHLYNPAFQSLRKYFYNKSKIKFIESISGSFGPFRQDINALWDWGPHDIAMCIDLIGKDPTFIEASYLSKSETNKGQIIQAKLYFDNQTNANLIFGNLLKKKRRLFDINYENSIYRYQPLSDKQIIKLKIINGKLNYSKELIAKNKKLPLDNLIDQFLIKINTKEKDIKDLELALKVTKVIDKISNILN